MLKRSEFKRGEFLVTSDGSIFIHDGYKIKDEDKEYKVLVKTL